MKNKKGFTLIELLAIIVILAIIAVITVPIILNIIENSKKGAAADSAYGFKDAINKAYLTKLSDDSDYNITDGTYTVSDLKTQIGLSLSGKEPASNSWVEIEKNNVTTGCLQYDEYKVEFTDGKVSNTEKGTCETNTPIVLEIGNTINYETSLNGVTLNDWKVFYIDGDYTYLILSGYLPYAAISSEIETYNVWASAESCTECYYPENSHDLEYVFGSTSRLSLINVLLNKNIWNDLLTGTINGHTVAETQTDDVWAIGTPTLEIWTTSWNSVYPNDTLYIKKTSDTSADGLYGYYIAKSENPDLIPSYYVNLTETAGYSNTLYFPYTDYDKYPGYWLANASAHLHNNGIYDDNDAMYIKYGTIDESSMDNEQAFRPVIKLPTSVFN